MKYILSHKEHPVLAIDIDEGTGTISKLGEVYSIERLPVSVQRKKDIIDRRTLNEWWVGRCIPASRSGLRTLLDTLFISSPQLLLTKCYGLSLSDQYWVKPKNSSLQWKDINFFDNPFSEDVGNILFGDFPDDKEDFNLLSPDNTSDGWLKKKWVIGNSKCQLIKSGSGTYRQEAYNEVLASAIMRRLEIPHIPYEVITIDEYPHSLCNNFISKETDLIPAWQILQTIKKSNNVSYYGHYVNCCKSLGLSNIIDFLDRMLTVDYIISNEDRHYNNFGVIRNASTLELINSAPIYDCGTSMWYNVLTTRIPQPIDKTPSKPFKKNHNEQIKLVTSFDWFDKKALSGIDEELRDILSDSITIDNERKDRLCYGLLSRIELLDEAIKNHKTDSKK